MTPRATAEDVTRALRRATAVPADELIDALRAIDAKDAQTAALVELLKPCGIWGDPTPSAASGGGDGARARTPSSPP